VVTALAALLAVAPAMAADEAPAGERSDRPFWEVGIGAGVVSFPDYVGSDRRRLWAVPVPYVLYESRFLTVDRGVLSGVLDLTDRLRVDLSLSGSLPVNSDDNHARDGMSDLDAIGEIGPSIKYDVHRDDALTRRITLELPVRSAFAVDLEQVEQVGWIVNPLVEYRQKWPLLDGKLSLRANTGPVFGSERYHAYFYRVRRRDERPGRPAYDAEAGYGGWRISGGLGWRWRDFWFGAFGRYINIEGATFDDSPLVRSRHYLAGGLGAAWIFAGSGDDGDR
jgi:outer membrane scaffolding protein for murein synthesis (MipA/OmpV family)